MESSNDSINRTTYVVPNCCVYVDDIIPKVGSMYTLCSNCVCGCVCMCVYRGQVVPFYGC